MVFSVWWFFSNEFGPILVLFFPLISHLISSHFKTYLFKLYKYGCFVCIYVCALDAYLVLTEAKRGQVSGTLKLELQTAMNHHVYILVKCLLLIRHSNKDSRGKKGFNWPEIPSYSLHHGGNQDGMTLKYRVAELHPQSRAKGKCMYSCLYSIHFPLFI